MVAALRVHTPGGPEVLTYEDVQIAAPGQGQIKIKQHACGVNFIDAYFRMGMYPSPVGLPFIAGNESAGEVIGVGPGVTDIKVGDRVAYVGPLGGYAAERVLPPPMDGPPDMSRLAAVADRSGFDILGPPGPPPGHGAPHS